MRRRVLLVLISIASVSISTAQAVSCPDVQPDGLTLASLLVRGLCLDPNIARVDAESSRVGSTIEEAASSTAWQLSVQAGPALTARQGTGGGTGSATQSGSLGASRVLADGGLTRARTTQREREWEATRADVETTRQDVLRDLSSLWSDAKEALAIRGAALVALEAARSSEAAARARLSAGTSTSVDALVAASTLAQAQRDVVTAEVVWRRRQVVIAERLGWPADTSVVLNGDDTAILEALGQAIGLGPSLLALDAHPQVIAQRERVLAGRSALDAARAEESPTITLAGSTGPDISRSRAEQLSQYGTTRRWNSEASLTWSMPLYDGGARSSRTAQRAAAVDAELARQAALERDLREGLWKEWTSWRSAASEVGAAQSAVSAAQAAEEAQRGRYQAGVGTLTDWLAAQSDVSSSMRQLASAEQSRLRAAVGTVHAMGRLTLESFP